MSAALLLPLFLVAQVPRIDTQLSPDSVAPGEMFVLRVHVETAGADAEIVLSRLPAGLEIIHTDSQSRLVPGFPSGTSRVVTRSWGLVSRLAGTFMLAATVRVGGRSYPGEEQVVNVRPPGPAPEGGLPVPRLLVSAEPARAWVGQAVLLQADAMFPRDVRSRLTRPATYEPPQAAGFWVVDLPSPMTLDLQRVGNDVFEVQTYRRVYIPIVPGSHVLTPARLSYEVREGLLQPPRSRLVESDSLRLEIRPLPEQGRPPTFAGAVGSYTMRAGISPAEVAVGEAATVSVEIDGKGDVRTVSAPPLAAGPTAEILPPSEDTDEQPTGTGIGGRKMFRWDVIVKQPGRLALGPVEFAFFDPEAGRYRVVRSDSLVLDVRGFGGSEESQGLRPADPEPSPPRLGFVRTPAFAIAQAVPAVLLILGWLRRPRAARKTKRRAGAPSEAVRTAIAKLAVAAERGEPGVADDLAALLRAVLADEAPAGARDRGREAEIAALLAAVDDARFGGGTGEVTGLVQRAGRLLGQNTRKGPGQLRALVLLPVLAALQAGAFERGVVGLAGREPAAARAAFQEYLATHPLDASAWYNLGNAAYREGDRGAATHAWLQALTLAPRREDARHNVLTVAGTGVARLLPSRFGLSGEAGVLLAALAWWAGAASFLLPRRGRKPAAVLALAVACTAGATWLIGRSAPELATVRSDGVAIRVEPALQADAVRPFVAGEPLEIRSRSDAWLRVRSAAGEEGWIEAVSLRFISRRPAEVQAPE